MTSETASTTDYESTYATYYAHGPTHTSFDPTIFPRVAAQIAQARGVTSLLDLGGGNGQLTDLWRAQGKPSLFIDVNPGEHPHGLHYALSQHEVAGAETVRQRITDKLGGAWLTTCLDVAEHIDIEHLSSFLANLYSFVDKWLVLSISTRPSSDGNRYHPTLLPIEVWQRLLNYAGFAIEQAPELTVFHGHSDFRGSDEHISVVAHWCRVNPFRDDRGHQHYLLLRKEHIPAPNPEPVLQALLDIDYRCAKRQKGAALNSKHWYYVLNFIQDWSYFRSLADVLQQGQLSALINTENFHPSHLHVVRNFLRRTNTPYTLIDDSEGVANLIESLHQADSITITATDGFESARHFRPAEFVLGARRKGLTTITLQHGLTIPKPMTTVAQTVLAWSPYSRGTILPKLHPALPRNIAIAGSPKFDDIDASRRHVLAARFGSWVDQFDRRVLIGTNLHWDTAHRVGEDEFYAWLEREVIAHPNILICLRPHPDDQSLYRRPQFLTHANVLLLDDIVTNALDVSIARLLPSFDACYTTYSTLILDCLLAGTPVVVFPCSPELREEHSAWLSKAATIDWLPMESWERASIGSLPVRTGAPAMGIAHEALGIPSFFAQLVKLLDAGYPGHEVCEAEASRIGDIVAHFRRKPSANHALQQPYLRQFLER